MKKLLLFSALLAIATMAMPQVKVTTAGNVGIGFNNPTQKLHVEGSSYLNGNVGIGDVVNPIYRLQVGGQSRFAAGWIGLILGWSSNDYCPAIYTDYNNALHLGRPDRWANHIWSYTIDCQSIVTTSDLRLKEKVEKCSSVLPKIQQIQTYTYQYNDLYFKDFTPEQKQKTQKKSMALLLKSWKKYFLN
jgi:hypothetical protein